jgi:oxaloacetate decarboxylase beta subunit
VLKSEYVGAIAVAAYSYMALVPIIQPFAIKLVTTKKERAIRMPYNPKSVSRMARLLFPIIVTMVAGYVAPASVSLVGLLMFGNLIRESGVLGSLSETAQNVLANLITLLLGITIAASMQADKFVRTGDDAHHGAGLARIHIRFYRRGALRQAAQPVFQEQGEPDGRCGRNLRVPDVRTRGPADGAGG